MEGCKIISTVGTGKSIKPLKLSRKGGIVVMGCHKYFMTPTGNKVNKLVGDD